MCVVLFEPYVGSGRAHVSPRRSRPSLTERRSAYRTTKPSSCGAPCMSGPSSPHSRDGDLHDVRDLVSPHGGAIQSRPKLLGLTCARPEPIAHLDSSARKPGRNTETSEAFCVRPEPLAPHRQRHRPVPMTLVNPETQRSARGVSPISQTRAIRQKSKTFVIERVPAKSVPPPR